MAGPGAEGPGGLEQRTGVMPTLCSSPRGDGGPAAMACCELAAWWSPTTGCVTGVLAGNDRGGDFALEAKPGLERDRLGHQQN